MAPISPGADTKVLAWPAKSSRSGFPRPHCPHNLPLSPAVPAMPAALNAPDGSNLKAFWLSLPLEWTTLPPNTHVTCSLTSSGLHSNVTFSERLPSSLRSKATPLPCAPRPSFSALPLFLATPADDSYITLSASRHQNTDSVRTWKFVLSVQCWIPGPTTVTGA